MCPNSYNCSVTALTFKNHYNLCSKCFYLAYEMIMKLFWQYVALRLYKREPWPNPWHVYSKSINSLIFPIHIGMASLLNEGKYPLNSILYLEDAPISHTVKQTRRSAFYSFSKTSCLTRVVMNINFLKGWITLSGKVIYRIKLS